MNRVWRSGVVCELSLKVGGSTEWSLEVEVDALVGHRNLCIYTGIPKLSQSCRRYSNYYKIGFYYVHK